MSTSIANANHPYVLSAYRTLDIESASLAHLKLGIGESFIQSVDLLIGTLGRVIVMGMGKSGHIGRKIAATLSSTGTPAFFVHPAEASHGDLGMVTKSDTVLAISNSGQSDELTVILPLLIRLGIPIIAMTGNAISTLATHSTHVLSTHVDQEACPLNLAPTASTTAQLAMGDALAIACLERRGFQATDFAASHPGGTLGRKLLTLVASIMRTGASIPIATEGLSFLEMMKLMSTSGLGLAISVNEQGEPSGIFTDGDLRRALMRGVDVVNMHPAALMRTNPKTINASALAVDAAVMMETLKVTSLLVTDALGHLVGVLNTNDLMRAKVI
jgi:arabinose-5-phosphate isomerase